MRRGQVWTLDFTLGLVLFSAAAILAYSMITNAVSDRQYEEVLVQAEDAAELLAGEGYPTEWTNDTVLRAGLNSDRQLSLRKTGELSKLTEDQLRKSLRATDSIYVYATNRSGAVQGIFGECGLGDLSQAEIENNKTLRAMAIAPGGHPFSDLLDITIYDNASAYSDLRNQDIIILEGNLSNNTDIFDAQIVQSINDAAEKGITIIIVGDPGVPVVGVDVNVSLAEELQVQGNAGWTLNLSENEILNVTGQIATIDMPVGVAAYETIALSNEGKIAYATWVYDGARVWYLAETAGKREDDSDLRLALANATKSMITVPWPDCDEPEPPAHAKQVAHHSRTIAYHDELITLRVLAWRIRS